MANLKQKVAFSTSTQIIGRVVQMAIGLISVTILTRYFGIADYGNYAIIFVYAGFAAVFADFGSTTLIVREAAQDRAPLEELLGSGFVVNALFGLGIFLFFVAILQVMPYQPQVKTGSVMALLAVFIGNLNIYGSYYTYRVRQDMMVLIETLGRVLGLILLIWFIHLHLSFLWIIVANTLSIGFNALFGTVLVLRERIKPRFNLKLAKFIFIHSIPLGVVAVLGLIHFKIDSILLSIMKRPSDVAIYSVAYKVVDLLVTIPSFFMSAMYPVLAASYMEKNDFQSKAQRALEFIFMLGLPAMAGAFLLAPDIVSLLGSSKYIAAATPLRILVLAVFLSFLTMFHNTLAIVAHLQKRLIAVSAVSVVVNIAANLILIPILSFRGAAIATIISEAIALSLVVRLINREVGFKRSYVKLPRIMAATIFMSVVIALPLSLGTGLRVLVGMAVYSLGLLVFRAVSLDEIRSFIPTSSKSATK